MFRLLVVDRKVIAFKPNRPFIGMIWLEIMSDVLFCNSKKSFVAFLNRYAYISYKYFEVGKIKIKILTAMITTLCVEEPVGLPGSRFSAG